MKRILFVHSSLMCGGIETALLDLCSLMDKEKYEITILEYIGYKNVLKPQFVEAGLRVISPYYRLVPGKNIVHKGLNVLRQKYITWQVYKRQHFFIQERFDIIVYFQVMDFQVHCLSEPRVIQYVHGDVGTSKEYGNTIIRLKSRFLRANKVICVSKRATESLKQVTGISENTVAVFNPINSSKILSRANESINEKFNRPYICAVGRLAPEKRFDALVRIHKNLLDRGLDHDLVIVGEGNEREKIESIIRETGTKSSVHLLGFKENPYPYMKNSLFTVCSSDTEGLPVISMESLLLGKPIVSSFPTVGELFGEEECGIITEMDVNSLEEGIYRMLSDQTFYEKCVKAAKARSAFFDSQKMIQQVEQVLDEVLELNV